MNRRLLGLVILALGSMGGMKVQAEPLRIASASSLAGDLRARLDPQQAQVIPGATGKLSSQITHGAPFDLFLAADSSHPRQLLLAGHALDCRRVGQGALVVWSRLPQVPTHWRDGRISIAEPRVAPYGWAARQALEKLGAWSSRDEPIIRGQNVAQAMQFAASGHVDVALISLAQARYVGLGSYLTLDPQLYDGIEHQLCLLQRAPATARTLWLKLLSDYGAPHDEPG